VDSVVGTDQEISAGLLELRCRLQHQITYALPVVALKALNVKGERRRVHRDFRVRVRAQKPCTFNTDGSIAKRRTFRGTADHADMLGHGRL
jgi:hypothetical protein